MREKKRLSDDMMEFVISQLKFKKADEPLLENLIPPVPSKCGPNQYCITKPPRAQCACLTGWMRPTGARKCTLPDSRQVAPWNHLRFTELQIWVSAWDLQLTYNYLRSITTIEHEYWRIDYHRQQYM